MDEPRYHKVARCRWCVAEGRRGFFVQVYDAQWLCEHFECANRQIANAVLNTAATSTTSPYLYLPTPAQCELHEAKAPNVLFGGAAAGSKSHGLRWNAYKSCLTIKNYSVLLLRRTFPELESTHLWWMEREQKSLNATLKSKKLTFADTGAEIRCGHCDTYSDLSKHLSTECDEIVFDEGTTFDPDMVREISSRARSSKQDVIQRGGAFVRIGSNPGGPAALYLYDLYITKKPDRDEVPHYRPDDFAFIRAKVEDNPYAPEDYIETRLDTLNPTRQKQLRDGDWSVFGSQFFGDWNPDIHVRSMSL